MPVAILLIEWASGSLAHGQVYKGSPDRLGFAGSDLGCCGRELRALLRVLPPELKIAFPDECSRDS